MVETKPSDAGAGRQQHVVTIAPPRLGDFWGVLSSLPAYLGLFRVFVLRQVSVRYRQSVFGILWVIIQPVATTLIVLFMFKVVGAHTSSGGLPTGLFTFVGVLTWQFFSRGVQDGTMSLRNNSNILTKIYFPRIILPISGVLTAWFEVVVTLAVLMIVCLAQSIPLSPRIVMLPGFLILMSLAALAISVWLAPINALIRDVTFILPFALQFGMFGSPVLFGENLVPKKWNLLFHLNPVSTLLEGVRWSIFRDQPSPNLTYFAINVGTILVLLLAGLVAFQKFESPVVDRI